MPRSPLPVRICAALLLSGVPIGLAGCTDERVTPPATSAGTPAPTPAAEETPGLRACEALAAAVADGSLMTAGVVDAIVRASATADAPVEDAAHRMAAAYAAAVAAAGLQTEPDAVAAVSAAAADMSVVCADSGLETAG